MVLDHFGNAARYRGLHPRLARGFEWLASLPADLAPGRHDIDGDNLFALVQSYETGPASAKQFESHRINLDIQYVAAGTETILVTPTGGLKPAGDYDLEKDIIFYEDPPASTALRCSAGSFTLFFPEDAHKPGCFAGAPSQVRKIVVKVRL